MNDKETRKSKIKMLKEIWKNPRKKALIKLSGYFLLFFIIIVGSIISNSFKTMPAKEEKTEFVTNYTYSGMQQNLLTNEYEVKYEITNNNTLYKINGKLDNNILTGYLELPDLIIKIKYEDNIFYQTNNDLMNEYDLTNIFDKELINIKNLFLVLSTSQSIIKTNDNSKVYSYVININNMEYNVLVEIDKNYVKNITISNDASKVLMSFDNITK